jgi:hypothetical protein
MRAIVVPGLCLFLGACALFQAAQPPAPPQQEAAPASAPRHRHHNADKPPAAPTPAPAPAASIDYKAGCEALARQRAEDAKNLGAPSADQQKIHDNAYSDCTAMSAPHTP